VGTISFGIVGVMIGVTVVGSARRIWMLAVALRELQLSFTTYLKNIQSSLAATMLMAIVVWGVGVLFGHSLAATRLIAQISAGAAVYGISILISDRSVSSDVRVLAASVLTPKTQNA
jgi:hypothetical protein